MSIDMSKSAINKLKTVLTEQSKVNKWFTWQFNTNKTIISHRYSNIANPSKDNLVVIARLLSIGVREFINPTKLS